MTVHVFREHLEHVSVRVCACVRACVPTFLSRVMFTRASMLCKNGMCVCVTYSGTIVNRAANGYIITPLVVQLYTVQLNGV